MAMIASSSSRGGTSVRKEQGHRLTIDPTASSDRPPPRRPIGKALKELVDRHNPSLPEDFPAATGYETMLHREQDGAIYLGRVVSLCGGALEAARCPTLTTAP